MLIYEDERSKTKRCKNLRNFFNKAMGKQVIEIYYLFIGLQKDLYN